LMELLRHHGQSVVTLMYLSFFLPRLLSIAIDCQFKHLIIS
jgi:hypothetical protein